MKNICLLLFSQLVFSQLQVSFFYPTFGASGNYFGKKVEINNYEIVVSSGFNNSFNQLGKVYVFDHPLIQHKTAIIRKTETSTKDFRQLVKEIAMLMGYEALSDLETQDITVKTPIEESVQPVISGKKLHIGRGFNSKYRCRFKRRTARTVNNLRSNFRIRNATKIPCRYR